MRHRISISTGLCTWALLAAAAGAAAAQNPTSSPVTYQGRIEHNGVALDGPQDLEFRVFDAASGGTQIGPTVTLDDVLVIDGRFSAELSIENPEYSGEARWLEIQVRDPADGQYSATGPRQPLPAAPYADCAMRTAQWHTVDSGVRNSILGQFVGINRSTRASALEFFGVQAPVTSGYGGMYVRTGGSAGLPFYGYSNGVQAAWTEFDGLAGAWRLFNGNERLTVTSTGPVGISNPDPAARLDVAGLGLTDAVYAENTGSGRAGHFHLGVGAPSDALQSTANGSGKAAFFESHQANSTPAVTVFKNGGGPALAVDGDLEVHGKLRGKCGSATAQLTPIAYARYRSLFAPMTPIATSPNVTLDPSSNWITMYIDDESDPSSWVVLASMSFDDPGEVHGYDELRIMFGNDDAQPFVRITTDCYNWTTNADDCFESPTDDVYFDVVVYRP